MSSPAGAEPQRTWQRATLLADANEQERAGLAFISNHALRALFGRARRGPIKTSLALARRRLRWHAEEPARSVEAPYFTIASARIHRSPDTR